MNVRGLALCALFAAACKPPAPQGPPPPAAARRTPPTPHETYLAAIHARLHPHFAGYLETLGPVASEMPTAPSPQRTDVELVIDGRNGAILVAAVTRSIGDAAFDDAALASLGKASPFGVPPVPVLSADGKVYVHYEFRRHPVHACSTYFARFGAPPSNQRPPPPESNAGH